MKKAVKITALILMGLIILFNILTAVINVAGKSADYRWLPFTFLTVETGSMEPELSAGDLVICRDVPYEEIQVGDVVTFRQVESLVTHKVIRKEGSRLVTKGIANNAEDKSFSRDDYRGKMVASVPKLGKILTVFKSPVSLLCIAVVLFGLFYGKNLIRWIEAKTEKRKEKLFTGSVVRPFGLLTAVSLLVLTPTLTEAKYTALVNAQAAVSAERYCFTSNYLTEAQAPYTITGWSGSSFGLTINVNNSENRLRFNKTGQDIVYEFIVIKVANEDGVTYKTDYTITTEAQSGVVPASEETADAFTYHPDIEEQISRTGSEVTILGPYILEGNDTGGISNGFTILSESSLLNPLSVGDSVRYKVFAVTSYNSGYYMNLSSDMIMTVSGDRNFIKEQIKSTTKGDSLLTFAIRTGLMDGSGTKKVKVTWDNREVYLNEYEKNAFAIINNMDESYYHPGTDTDTEAYLIVPLTAYAEVELEFFKYDVNDENDDITIEAELDSSTDTD